MSLPIRLNQHAGDEAPIRLRPTCLHMRHKLMYCDSRHDAPGMVDDSSSTRVFLCAKSQEVLGPDGEAVHPDTCDSGRACFCHAHPSAR